MDYKKNLPAFLILLLSAVILGFSFQVHRELRALRSQMPSDNSYLYHSLQSSIRNLENELSEIKKGTQWISDMNFTPNKNSSTAAAVLLDVEWTFRELEQGAQVHLYYRDPSWSEWMVLEPVSQGGMNYGSTLRLDSAKEYEIQVHTDGTVSRSSEHISVPKHLYQPAALEVFGFSTSFDHENSVASFRIELGTFQEPYYDFHVIRSMSGRFVLDGTIYPVVAENLEERFQDYTIEDLESLRQEDPVFADAFDNYWHRYINEGMETPTLWSLSVENLSMEEYTALEESLYQNPQAFLEFSVTYEGGTLIHYRFNPMFDYIERVQP